jgi:flavin-dependent dehydrogenase
MEVNGKFDLVVIGAGPAGCAAAICAADRGLRVLLLEAGRYPRHKVCGEFVSAEAAQVLRHVCQGSAELLDHAPRITHSRLNASGTCVSMRLAQPGYSIPRIKLDECLWQAALAHGVECHTETANSVTRNADGFLVAGSTATFAARAAINASGRWSRISDSVPKGDPWVGLKAHFSGETDDAVELYFMDCGYLGVQAVAPGLLNACALVKQGTVTDLADVFRRDSILSERAKRWTRVSEPYATYPVYLGLRSPVRDGVLQAGDAAGFVDPFVGDGISLALCSGVLAGRTVLDRSPDEYATLYSQAFNSVFRTARRIRSVLAASNFARPLLLQGVRVPALADRLFRSTRASALDVLSPSIH